MRLDELFLLGIGALDGCVEYAGFALAKRAGKAAFRIGRSIGAHELPTASAGSVTLQKAAQIME
jgi:hypothetical protein